MKEIGICTLHGARNFGAILQAFALQETLESMNYKSKFLLIENSKEEPTEMVSTVQEEKFESSRKALNRNNILHKDEQGKYDAIIVGSDEMWNLEEDSFKHHKEYFGYNLNADKIIAYAPSCNITKKEKVIEYFKDEILEEANFNKFNHLSARDMATRNLINSISGAEPTLVLDPTFLIKDYNKYIKETTKRDYILIYGYRFSESEKNKIIELSKETGLPIYSIGFKMDWADATLDADIFEFLGYIKNATYTICSSFHGVVFSLIFEKQFVAFVNNKAKIEDILNRFDLKYRDASNAEEIVSIIQTPIDIEKLQKLKNDKIKISLEYLKNAIEN